MFEADDNPVDPVDEGEFLPPRPIMVQEMHQSVQQRLVRLPDRRRPTLEPAQPAPDQDLLWPFL